ncbi:diaminopimelate decarboxylase [Ructibacterium gallinarum]|uniref:Diaminopimelate decarboxylase n=1 Tax=Ructibacterium gallinarum TaxID=2779355 RepID=A0A9D5LYN7_9FIRM|nr:diaminopimelate decarboxylase [Ructibacterium gallinarum]MBE5039322.1 diaminopimelate decarboxylase [Ructibacterium gallinarum]
MQFVMDCLQVGREGILEIGGCSLTEIAREFKTPAYVMDENEIRKNCQVYLRAMEEYYGGNGMVLYASKALSCKEIYRIMQEEGMGIDVVSGGELYTALEAGFPAKKIYFHGNNKTKEEIVMALENGVGRIVVDNMTELEMLEQLAAERNLETSVLFRIKPGIDAHTHSFIQTGQIDSKFGVALETGEAEEIVRIALRMPHINVVGVHCHIGSQIFDLKPFQLAAKTMMEFIGMLKEKYGAQIQELNLGGGYGIKYVQEDTPVDYDKYIEAVARVVREESERLHVAQPFILMEPGRSIVASAGLTLYTVGVVKEIPSVRTYVSVDGGMGDNPRHIMYGSEYEAVLPENPEGEREMTVTIAGKCCESGDVLIRDAKLPKVKPGDLLAVLATGAYNYSMASNYNRIPRPPIIMVKDGKARLAVRRETYQDLVACDV